MCRGFMASGISRTRSIMSNLQARADSLHVVSEAELPLEGACGNALVQELPTFAFPLLAGDHQQVGLRRDRQIVRRKSSNRKRAARSLLAGLLDVVGWIMDSLH